MFHDPVPIAGILETSKAHVIPQIASIYTSVAKFLVLYFHVVTGTPRGPFSGKTEADDGVVCFQTGFADRRIEYETFAFPRKIEALLHPHKFP